MTATTAANPFIKTTAAPFNTQYIDCVALAGALAELIGGRWIALDDDDDGRYGIGRIDMGGGLFIGIRQGMGAIGRISVFAYASRELETAQNRYDREAFPSATMDSGKGLAAVAKDIKRRVVDKAGETLAKLQTRLDEQKGWHLDLMAHCDALQAAMPSLRIERPSANNRTTETAFSGRAADGSYVTGRLNCTGSISFDRIGGADNAKGLAVLAALLA